MTHRYWEIPIGVGYVKNEGRKGRSAVWLRRASKGVAGKHSGALYVGLKCIKMIFYFEMYKLLSKFYIFPTSVKYSPLWSLTTLLLGILCPQLLTTGLSAKSAVGRKNKPLDCWVYIVSLTAAKVIKLNIYYPSPSEARVMEVFKLHICFFFKDRLQEGKYFFGGS